MIIDFQLVISIPATNSSVITTISIDIRNQMSHRLSIRIGRVMSLRIPHTTRLVRPRINVNTKRELVPLLKIIPER